MGTIFWSLGALEKAKMEFIKVLEIKPDIATIHNNLAAIYLKSGEYKNAIPHLENLVNLQPQNANARELLKYSLAQIK